MRKTLAIGAILATAILAGCGDTDSNDGDTAATTGAGAGGDTIDVVAEDIAFGEDGYEAAAGEVAFTYVNEGAIPHTLVIEDVDGFKLEVPSAGDEDQGTAELEAGSYVLFCDIPGHRDAGMEATLEVS